MSELVVDDIDLISVDLDGNDLYFCEELLKNGFNRQFLLLSIMQNFHHQLNFVLITILVIFGMTQIILAHHCNLFIICLKNMITVLFAVMQQQDQMHFL